MKPSNATLWLVALAVLALSAAQLRAGLLSGTETAAFVAPFVALTTAGLWLSIVLLRNCTEPSALHAAYA